MPQKYAQPARGLVTWALCPIVFGYRVPRGVSKV